MKLTPDELAHIGEDEAARAKREARRAASRDARSRAQAELDAALVAPLVPNSPPRELSRIDALKPRYVHGADECGLGRISELKAQDPGARPKSP